MAMPCLSHLAPTRLLQSIHYLHSDTDPIHGHTTSKFFYPQSHTFHVSLSLICTLACASILFYPPHPKLFSPLPDILCVSSAQAPFALPPPLALECVLPSIPTSSVLSSPTHSMILLHSSALLRARAYSPSSHVIARGMCVCAFSLMK